MKINDLSGGLKSLWQRNATLADESSLADPCLRGELAFGLSELARGSLEMDASGKFSRDATRGIGT